MHDNPYRAEECEGQRRPFASRIRWRIIPVTFLGGAGAAIILYRCYLLAITLLSKRPWFHYRFNFAIRNMAELAFGLLCFLLAINLWRGRWRFVAILFALLVLGRMAINVFLTGLATHPI